MPRKYPSFKLFMPFNDDIWDYEKTEHIFYVPHAIQLEKSAFLFKQQVQLLSSKYVI